MKLFVGNLPYDINDTKLTEMFAPFGTVVSSKVVTDYFSGETKGFGFVEMSSRSEGHKAMEELKSKMVGHRGLVVNEAQPEKKRGKHRR